MSDEVEVSVLQSKPEDDPTKAQEARLSGILQASDCEFLKMEPELRKNIRKNFLDLKIAFIAQSSSKKNQALFSRDFTNVNLACDV